MSRLEARGLTKRYGGLTVADGVDLALAPGARTALIGPNGAGKTTLANLLTGIARPSAGQVLLDGRDITGLSEAGRVRAGVAKTFQTSTLFAGLSVADNLRLPLLERRRATWRMWRPATADAAVEGELDGLLAAFDLGPVAGRPAGTLAYGQQRLVELALTLALRPRVLILDEPAAGVPRAEAGLVLAALRALPADLAVLIIEHDMALVFELAERIVVLVQGRVLTEGAPAEIAADRQVRRLYLGAGHG